MKRSSMYLLAAWACLSLPAFGADLDAVVSECNDCHGDNGVSQWADVPTIAGLPMFYQADQLYFFGAGERPCSSSEYRQGDTSRPATSMCDVASALSEEEFDAIAEHYAALPFEPAEQAFDPALAAAGKTIHEAQCERCHADGGSSTEDEAGILAGQWMGYLREAMTEFRAGEREQLDTMKEKVDALSDENVEALLHYYASQQ